MSPYVTHPVGASIKCLVLTAALGSLAEVLAPTQVQTWVAALVTSALVVVAFYHGRESGQREHDLKHTVPPHGAVSAFLGAELMYGWTVDNLLQWMAAVAGVLLSSAAIVAVKYWA